MHIRKMECKLRVNHQNETIDFEVSLFSEVPLKGVCVHFIVTTSPFVRSGQVWNAFSGKKRGKKEKNGGIK